RRVEGPELAEDGHRGKPPRHAASFSQKLQPRGAASYPRNGGPRMHRQDVRPQRWFLAAGSAALAALLFAGCAWFGGRGAQQVDRDEVLLGDFYFEPAELEVQSGQEVTLRLRN